MAQLRVPPKTPLQEDTCCEEARMVIKGVVGTSLPSFPVLPERCGEKRKAGHFPQQQPPGNHGMSHTRGFPGKGNCATGSVAIGLGIEPSKATGEEQE